MAVFVVVVWLSKFKTALNAMLDLGDWTLDVIQTHIHVPAEDNAIYTTKKCRKNIGRFKVDGEKGHTPFPCVSCH